MTAHAFGAWLQRRGRLCWLVYCRKCGLIRLNNDRTRAAITTGCDG